MDDKQLSHFIAASLDCTFISFFSSFSFIQKKKGGPPQKLAKKAPQKSSFAPARSSFVPSKSKAPVRVKETALYWWKQEANKNKVWHEAEKFPLGGQYSMNTTLFFCI